jgi:putative SOS response-associated peptidase YedK
MCGRYTIYTNKEALEARFHAALQGDLSPSYNAAPSQDLPVIVNEAPDEIRVTSWGFIPEWAEGKAGIKAVINARAESIATKPFFRDAFKKKRCLVLSDGFYEWQKGRGKKTPFRIALKTEEPFAFAGLWRAVHDESGKVQHTFAIITTEANELVAHIHTRMPVILHAEDEAEWLDPGLSNEDAESLLVPYPAEMLQMYEVSTRVNSPTYNTEGAIQPVKA